LESQPAAEPDPDAGRRNKTSPWLAAGVMGLVSLCLSTVVVLGILGLVNGGLAYAPRSKAILLESQLAGIFFRLDEQERDLAALRTRLQALETLNGRVTGVEQENQSLRQEIAKQVKNIDDLQDEIDSLQSEMKQMAGRSRDFETFLQGLAELLAGLQSAQEVQP
jgi:chromosome segregation ATPase